MISAFTQTSTLRVLHSGQKWMAGSKLHMRVPVNGNTQHIGVHASRIPTNRTAF